MIKWFQIWLKDNFGFSKTESNGTIVLIFLILFIAIIPRILINQFYLHENSFNIDKDSLDIWGKELKAQIQEKQNLRAIEEKSVVNEKHTLERFSFNPNTATIAQLSRLGFKPYVCENIINYRKAGGSFSIKADLQKIYGISNDRIDELWSFIELPEEKPSRVELVSNETEKTQITAKKPTPTIEKLELNTVTAEQLQQIQGIGPAYSKRIVEYRNKLGGFISSEQLFEVWGIKEEIVIKLIEQSEIRNSPNKIDINTDSLKHLYFHPYIDYNTAKVIHNYRKQRGRLDSIEQLKEIKIISDSLYQKIYPYLSTQ